MLALRMSRKNKEFLSTETSNFVVVKKRQ